MGIDDLEPYKFKPGQSGNPAGRPKGAKETIESKFKRILRKSAPPAIVQQIRAAGFEIDEGTLEECLICILAIGGLKGDRLNIKDIFDRIYGQPKQAVEHSGDIDAPLAINVHLVTPALANSETPLLVNSDPALEDGDMVDLSE